MNKLSADSNHRVVLTEINGPQLNLFFNAETMSRQMGLKLINEGISLTQLPQELLKDREVVLHGINHSKSIINIPQKFLSDKEIVLTAITKQPKFFLDIPKKFQLSTTFVTEACKKNPRVLKYTDEKYRAYQFLVRLLKEYSFEERMNLRLYLCEHMNRIYKKILIPTLTHHSSDVRFHFKK